jgi:hypothetical protein
MFPAGVRSSTTESWGSLQFEVTNDSDTDRQARVLAFYNGQPDVQYGRDVWVPARSTLRSWLLTGPAPAQSSETSRQIQFLLYEHTGGEDRLILPRTDERVRSRGVSYRRREVCTAILVDLEDHDPEPMGQLPQPDSTAREALNLVRSSRAAAGLSEFVQIITSRIPPNANAFDGIDQLVLASNRFADDPAGVRALRHWLEGGGRLWVMLDMVRPDALGPVLGDALDFHAVDRSSLTSFKMEYAQAAHDTVGPTEQQHEQPVEMVRVMLPAQERGRHIVKGWPAWFTRPVGQGKVVFSTLGLRAWTRTRGPNERPPFPNFDRLPLPTPPLEMLAYELRVPRAEETFPVTAFQPLLTEEIGYAVISRVTVGFIFGGFLLGTLALGLALRRSRRPELLGWLGSAAALASAGTFLALGESSRRAASPTVAVGQVVDAASGTEDAAVDGLLAVYRPDSGPATMGANQGGLFELDVAGLEGRTRRFISTDMDAWHWDNLELPAGVRTAPLRYTVSGAEPITAIARFDSDGLVGKLAAGPFQNLGDALLHVGGGRNFAVRLAPDGSFRAANQDLLPAGQFLASAVLSDRQQRRQELYREFLKRSDAGRFQDRATMFAWADPVDMHFTFDPGVRLAGTALLAVPIQLKHSALDAQVTVPGAFVSCRRVLPGGLGQPLLRSHQAVEMHLRFQLPAAVLPLQVQRARLAAKIEASSRRVLFALPDGDQRTEVYRVDSPVDPIRVDFGQERLLRPDAEGGVHVYLTVGDTSRGGAGSGKSDQGEQWTIEYLELEITGRTATENGATK